ncbi:hypothetical protein [Clavibacter sp. VKM Ac-2872]|uniref:hypothetical protein n=1 Tax=Clavibacter sp. VKM Ac-2872 TaxID=2783812 RepID=UPI00188DB235|nr:hypothetical protein [Clavibacter sp. VKM Ac-2872]MBF4625513.1 hypothetical protein [Clavibacter sp. VKM Ac-2872]
MTKYKSTTPKDPRNGFAEMDHELLQSPPGARFTAIVTYEVVGDVGNRVKHERHPILEAIHIEPITAPDALVTVSELQDSAHQVRTGETQLDLPQVGDEDEAVEA